MDNVSSHPPVVCFELQVDVNLQYRFAPVCSAIQVNLQKRNIGKPVHVIWYPSLCSAANKKYPEQGIMVRSNLNLSLSLSPYPYAVICDRSVRVLKDHMQQVHF